MNADEAWYGLSKQPKGAAEKAAAEGYASGSEYVVDGDGRILIWSTQAKAFLASLEVIIP